MTSNSLPERRAIFFPIPLSKTPYDLKSPSDTDYLPTPDQTGESTLPPNGSLTEPSPSPLNNPFCDFTPISIHPDLLIAQSHVHQLVSKLTQVQ